MLVSAYPYRFVIRRVTMKFIIGKKLNMTQLYAEDGSVVPVTVVSAAPGVVVQVKTPEQDGYAAVQFGFEVGSKHASRAVLGHIKGKLKCPYMRELRIDDTSAFSVGQRYDLTSFIAGDMVAVSGTSKGRGFAGVVKRHGFHGSAKTHGHKHDLRAPGSIGSTDSARVFPGMRMAGRMGGTRVTVPNLRIAQVDADSGLLYIRGAVPGSRNGIIEIRAEGEMSPVEEIEAKKEKTTDNQPDTNDEKGIK